MSKFDVEDKHQATSWAFPSFGGEPSLEVDVTKVKALTAGDLEKLQQQAMQEASAKGYQEGLAKGLKAAEAELAKKLNMLDSVVRSLAAPFEEFDGRVENEMAALAIQIARQLVRRELKMDSGQVVSVVKEALSALPSSSQNIRLFLHPEDAEIVRSAFSIESADESRWSIVNDPVVSRGGCRVMTDASTIDASVENRLATIIAQALGDERSG